MSENHSEQVVQCNSKEEYVAYVKESLAKYSGMVQEDKAPVAIIAHYLNEEGEVRALVCGHPKPLKDLVKSAASNGVPLDVRSRSHASLALAFGLGMLVMVVLL